MGRKSRLKKLRTKLTDKLKAIGLEDQIYFVASKEFKYLKPVLDGEGKVAKDENGKDKMEVADAKMYSAKNPLRQLYRKIMKGSPENIEKFIKSFEDAPVKTVSTEIPVPQVEVTQE